ncbi:MAG: hypothetical protein ACR2PL_08570 [Dehalococcoidia bacterium]
MGTLSLALPLMAGKADQLRSFSTEVLGQRRADFEASEQRIGLTREIWYHQSTPQGDLLIIWVEGADPLAALGAFGASQDQFDRWFKQQVNEMTGVDLNQPPPGPPPQVVFDWAH